MKNIRMFLEPRGRSMLFLDVPVSKYDEFEVTMRDCSRQTHWMFSADRRGLAKAKKVAKFFNDLVAAIEEQKGKK